MENICGNEYTIIPNTMVDTQLLYKGKFRLNTSVNK